MPNYTYRCECCGIEEVHQRKIAERDEDLTCEFCETHLPDSPPQPMTRKLEAPALQDFAGSHRDEYTKTGPRK